MSYDLMVFDRKGIAENKEVFMAWYEEFTQWKESVDYYEISHTTEALKAWFMEMIQIFPPMNGNYAPSDEAIDKDEDLLDRLCEYNIGAEGIYVAFAWSKSTSAYETTVALAKKHKIGFFDVSGSDGDIIMPK